jgi:hypothetical protein
VRKIQKGGDIGSLCHRAVASYGKPDARFLLQDRNDAIGCGSLADHSWLLNAREIAFPLDRGADSM